VDDCDFSRLDSGPYPPDGAPFAAIENAAECCAQRLGYTLGWKMSTPHLLAWGVACGVLSKAQAIGAIEQARAKTAVRADRLIELRRLLTPYFARCGRVEILAVKMPGDLAAKPVTVTEGVRLMALRICQALDGRPEIPCRAAELAAIAVEQERLDLSELWAMVADARREAPERPRSQFHLLIFWVERLYLLRERRMPTAPPLAEAFVDVDELHKWLAPSGN